MLCGLLAAGCAEMPHYTPYRTYYVSPDGDDSADGRGPDTAWRTLKRADTQQLAPGDRLLLKGGERFHGRLELRAGDAGRPNHPVTVGSYGNGRATIASANTPALTVYDTGGVDVRGLRLTGGAEAYRGAGGVHVYSDRKDEERLRHVTLSGVEVTGFRTGVQIGAAPGAAGFEDVRVENAELHRNQDSGLLTYAGRRYTPDRPEYAHAKVTLHRVNAHHNAGDPDADRHHTGNGVVLGSVSEGTVSESTAHDNGARSSSAAREGPVGIWAYDSTRLDIRHNSAYRQHTGSRVDGAGFGLDANVSHSVVQHNVSFRNDGPGYHTYTEKENGAFTDNVLRYNVSGDDGRKLPGHGAIDIHGAQVRDLDVHHNTVVITGAGSPGQRPAVRLVRSMEHTTVRDNLFLTDGSPFVIADRRFTRDDIVFRDNAYAQWGSSWALYWGDRTYKSLGEWRAATGQEREKDAPTGLGGDACLERHSVPAVTSVERAEQLTPPCPVLAEGDGTGAAKPRQAE